MKKLFLLAVVAGFSVQAAMAGTVALGFDGLQSLEPINNYYNGGTGGFGSSGGPNYGVWFTSNALALGDAYTPGGMGSGSNVTNEPSFPNSMIFLSGAAATMNVPAGFTGGFSFYYAAPYYGGFINVWSGLNDTGTLLATLSLSTTGGCSGWPNYCIWDPIGVTFDGTAESVDFGGTENYIAFDQVTMGSGTPEPGTPEPASLMLLATGLIGVATSLRYRSAKR